MTQVMVDPRDPAFENPSKPIGPFFTAFRAAALKKGKEVADGGRQRTRIRRVVASPLPQRIINVDIIRDAVRKTESASLQPVEAGSRLTTMRTTTSKASKL